MHYVSSMQCYNFRSKLRTLLKSGRLEITTGGWVMTDEANVDFFSMVDQLVEGHEFMRSELDVVPVSSWSVDSFGHGGAFPHLLSKVIEISVTWGIHRIKRPKRFTASTKKDQL